MRKVSLHLHLQPNPRNDNEAKNKGAVSKLSKWHLKKTVCVCLMVLPRGRVCAGGGFETLGGGSLKFHLFS